jgi:hypothetical protein
VRQTAAWPAYLVAAVCFVIALISSIANISLMGQVKQQQRDLNQLSERSTALARSLLNERTALFDILDPHARHYDAGDGEVIVRASRIYLAVHALAQPPHGKVYEAWVTIRGASRPSPSPIFLPDARGVAFILLPVDARTASTVSVTVEPESGSREPTSKPVMNVTLTSEP